jgi:hypothetical protein
MTEKNNQEIREVVKLDPKNVDVESTLEVKQSEFQIERYMKNAGNVKLTEDQKKILYGKVNENEVEIRPDGIIYLPWAFYVKRLHDSFGMEWALIPKGMPAMRDNLLIWPFYLIVKGSLMGFAIGEQKYFPGNKVMSFTDAAEGAKSNALMRLCKEIGISLELWQPEFIRNWIKNNCISEWYVDMNKGNKKVLLWRKKTSDRFKFPYEYAGDRKQKPDIKKPDTKKTKEYEEKEDLAKEFIKLANKHHIPISKDKQDIVNNFSIHSLDSLMNLVTNLNTHIKDKNKINSMKDQTFDDINDDDISAIDIEMEKDKK